MQYDPDLFDAVEFGDLESVKRYWSKDINIDFQDNTGMTLLMFAVRFNYKNIVRFLLSLKPNLSLKNKNGETVFTIADELKDKEISIILSTK